MLDQCRVVLDSVAEHDDRLVHKRELKNRDIPNIKHSSIEDIKQPSGSAILSLAPYVKSHSFRALNSSLMIFSFLNFCHLYVHRNVNPDRTRSAVLCQCDHIVQYIHEAV